MLVHQLVRQHVLAKVLIDVLGCGREVIPFVVVDSTRGLQSHQVQFMVAQGLDETRELPDMERTAGDGRGTCQCWPIGPVANPTGRTVALHQPTVDSHEPLS